LNEYNYTRIMKYIEYVQTKPEWNMLWLLIKSTIRAENRHVVEDNISHKYIQIYKSILYYLV
jgi:hypothetical protein